MTKAEIHVIKCSCECIASPLEHFSSKTSHAKSNSPYLSHAFQKNSIFTTLNNLSLVSQRNLNPNNLTAI
jgi:hypothetical protein